MSSDTSPSIPDRPQAVLLMGDLVVLARQGRLVRETISRGLVPLAVVSTDTDLARLDAARSDASHCLHGLAEVVQVDDARITSVLPAVQPLLGRYDVRAVLSVGEVFVEPVGVLADCLGLPGSGSAAAVICRNKLLQRTAVPEFSPRWQVVPVAQRASFTLPDEAFPAVVKPAGRFYSSGVTEVAGQDELTAALAEFGDDEISLVESRVTGPEFSVEAFVQDGEVLWSGVTAKETNEEQGPYFTELSHTSPALLDEADEAALIRANTQILRRVGVRDGMTHGEYRLTSDGVVLMEIAARLPGDAITFLWELATGEPVEPVMLDLALGIPARFPAPRRRARQQFVDHPHGVLRDVTADGTEVSWPSRDDRWPLMAPVDADAEPGTRGVLVGRLPGDVLGEQLHSGHRSVSVVVDARLDADLDLAAKHAVERVSLHVDPV
ncbi:ATP-grasp domain-containing protein [Streptomyces beihaiensis]|uniref:ATP-grasp domain-containing protein n=1 Tax=Streptomyces beihaiensis TaxID=2984495 RepID=A0ABT3TXS4_9ACTN|nr:ATP-grasp domain-containing protein [Streptomyces beihaiensis]MCX3061848.1 ATP-grasp domain-containing protein [Streptomyces beihaiensis]